MTASILADIVTHRIHRLFAHTRLDLGEGVISDWIKEIGARVGLYLLPLVQAVSSTASPSPYARYPSSLALQFTVHLAPCENIPPILNPACYPVSPGPAGWCLGNVPFHGPRRWGWDIILDILVLRVLFLVPAACLVVSSTAVGGG